MSRFIIYVLRHTVANGQQIEEFIIDETNLPIKFESISHAISYLNHNGVKDEEIPSFCFRLVPRPPILQ